MCGIVGAIAERDVTPILLEGLKRLEYRGYDSAGIALLNNDQTLLRKRVKGKVKELFDLMEREPIFGSIGIAHTRWATHGAPSENNAHPQISNDEIAVVHNGIIENHEQLKRKLVDAGYKFTTETDTEVAVHLLHWYWKQQGDLLKALQTAVKELRGAYALGIMHKAYPQRLLAVRCGCPLVIGLGIKENFLASDILALLPVTNRFIYLEEGDIADINRDEVKIYDGSGKVVTRLVQESKMNSDIVDRGPYRHFMQKEIFEQPAAIAATLEGRLSQSSVLEAAFGTAATSLFDNVRQIKIVACGTSYHAGLIASYWIEEIAKIPCTVEIASEFRYRSPVVQANTLFVAISQSGETADTLAAVHLAKELGFLGILAICNVPESSLVRAANLVFMTRAGIEIGVASTKAFTTQLTALLLLTLVIARRHGLTSEKESKLVKQLIALPRAVEKALQTNTAIELLSHSFANKQHALFLGRGTQFPVALEGALKLKEISYIHAEAYPAGELKHGPLALVDSAMPVIAVAPNNSLLEKLKSNLQEVQARGGRLIVFTDKKAAMEHKNGIEIIVMPEVDNLIAPIVYTIPLQLLAYHVALIKGTDVDQPRNLAKSVTVE